MENRELPTGNDNIIIFYDKIFNCLCVEFIIIFNLIKHPLTMGKCTYLLSNHCFKPSTERMI
jgi:hypothetical protein